MFDVLLLSVIIVGAYLVPTLLRRGHRAYGGMVGLDLVLGLVAFGALQSNPDDKTGELIGFIAIGGFVCLVMVPPLLRDLARRCLLSDRLRLAHSLMGLRELLQPGFGAKQEAEVVETILAVRTGEVDRAISRLRERKTAAPDDWSRRQIEERIIMTFLYARRWGDAISEFEGGYGRDMGAISPQLMVEMVRAYCEREDLDRAAGLVERLEESPVSREPVFAGLISRSRMVFLAFVGRTGAVESIVGPSGPLAALPQAVRCFWSGIARLHAGDRVGARNALKQAKDLSGRDSRARELAEETLSSVDRHQALGPRPVSPEVAELADRLTNLASETATGTATPSLRRVASRRIPATIALLLANLVVSLFMTLAFDPGSDLGGLLRAGANVRPAVENGEWWRLVSANFLHGGVWHLALNMYGLWIIGRLVEQMFGSLRYFAIYMSSGIAGMLASFWFLGAKPSVGASGAVFGILGAAIAELAFRKRAYPERWRKSLLTPLLVLTLANVAMAFFYPIIDQAAHLGGLVVGAVLALLLSQESKFGTHLVTKALSALLALACLGAIAYGIVGVATTSYHDTLSAFPRVERKLSGLAVTVPKPWQPASWSEHYLEDGGSASVFELIRAPKEGSAEEAVEIIAEMQMNRVARRLGFARAAKAEASALRLPEGWSSRELIATTEGDTGSPEQRFRAVVFARESEGELWAGVLYHPASLSAEVQPTLNEVLASIRPDGPMPSIPTKPDSAEADASPEDAVPAAEK